MERVVTKRRHRASCLFTRFSGPPQENCPCRVCMIERQMMPISACLSGVHGIAWRGMLLAVEHLTKVFGKFKAVDNVSFAVDEGEIVGLVGPNGAGKTTTIHMLLGLISPTSGSISLFGKR